MKKWSFVFSLLVLGLAAGCGGGAGTTDDPDDPDDPVNPVGTIDSDVVGEWRIFSEVAYYDNGQTSTVTPPSTRLVLDSSGTWEFGSSSGDASVTEIDDADWTNWDIDPYDGATRKIVLDGWNDDVGEGPIDEPNGVIDNIWVIYATESEDNGPGTIWLKFGAAE